jgi:hypothetical protein
VRPSPLFYWFMIVPLFQIISHHSCACKLPNRNKTESFRSQYGRASGGTPKGAPHRRSALWSRLSTLMYFCMPTRQYLPAVHCFCSSGRNKNSFLHR